MSETIIEIKELEKNYKGQVIVKNINFVMDKGTITGIVGRNGSGKSIILKMIIGLIPISSGEIKIDGKTLKRGEIPKDLGIVVEGQGYVEHLTAIENLSILASIKNKISEKEIKEALELVGLDSENKLPMKKYSLGMKQRYIIAQAIMEKPKILVLDEAMNGLDEDGVGIIRTLLLNLKREGATILITSHNREDIEILCDNVYSLKDKVLEKI